MFALGWGEGGEAWNWRRRLLAWEEELLGECRTSLLTVSLQDNLEDSCVWSLEPGDVYIIRGAYHLLASRVSNHYSAVLDLI